MATRPDFGPIGGVVAEDWSKATVQIVAWPPDSAMVEALRADLTGRGAAVEAGPFDEAEGRGERSEQPSHLFAILPNLASTGRDERDRLVGMIGRLRTIASLAGSEGSTLTIVQFGGGRFGTGPNPADPETCAAASFARSLHLERPMLRVRVVDLDAGSDPVRAARWVVGEVAGSASFSATGFDVEGVRLVPKARLQRVTEYARRPMSWSAEDVIVVTGGAKGITAECALALGRSTGARLVLVGRSPVPKPGDRGELAGTLARFEAEGLSCRYESCDVADGAEVEALVERVRSEVGPITGVVHAAGVNSPRRVEQVGAELALAEVGPKVLGAIHLARALADQPPRLFVGFSSIIGVTGMPGNAWYAFSNEALDLILRRFGAEHPGTASLAIAFSVWGETGMGARLGSVDHLGRMGIGAIPTGEGVRRFLQLFEGDPAAGQVVVTARLGGLDTWPVAHRSGPSGLRFVDRVIRTEPGVDLVTRTRLTLERDPYVGDHIYRGSYLFPTVFGLEAMAQAAAFVTGEARPSIARIEDVGLDRPIVVDPERGVEIEIRAEALEPTAPGERPVRVGIRTEQTGFAADHFSAVLVLGEPAAAPIADLPTGEPLGLDPQTDLYGGLLFQGPRFRRMGRVFELDGDHAIFESEAREPSSLVESAFGTAESGPILLGDPFFRDVLLQAGQLTIPREICLPVRIGRIERFKAGPGEAGRRIVFAPFKVREGREYVAEIFATDESGRVLERLTGYRLRILEERPEDPSAEDLADPEGRDERIVREAIASALAEHGLTGPSVALADLPGLRSGPAADRHAREQPAVERSIRAALGLPPETPWSFEVIRESSGAPKLLGTSGIGLSISHDDRSCLCVAGPGAQGCDLEPIRPRSREDWNALLGDARMPLLDALLQAGDPLDRAGTRIWSAVEAIRKATRAVEFSLQIDSQPADAIVLKADGLAGSPRVLTLPVNLTFGPDRMLALVVAPTVSTSTIAPIEPARELGRGIDPDWHRVGVAHDGPGGQPVQELRFVVSFQESSTLGRRVPASKYLTWMGKMRELVTSPGAPSLVARIATGDWGLVTNWADVRVTGEATANDVIQMRFWADEPTGSEVTFYCDFWRVGPNLATPERVAFGAQKATWVRLVGHGQVAPEPFPPDFADFLHRMAPTRADRGPLPAWPESLSGLDAGPTHYRAPGGPSSGRLLRSETFQTTLEEANLVGNVYFANYFAWQGRVRDLFLHAVAPEFTRGVGERGELVPTHARVDYLREAMPFDRVAVDMRLRTASSRGLTLGFEYFRVLDDGRRQKLSVGTQDVLWIERQADGTPTPAPFPDAIRAALLGAGTMPLSPSVQALPIAAGLVA